MKQLNLLTSILAVLPLLPIKGQKVYELAAPLNPLKIEEGKLDLGVNRLKEVLYQLIISICP